MTDTVASELLGKGETVPDWAERETLDELEEVVAFAQWSTRVGADLVSDHNVGEAATLAWAEFARSHRNRGRQGCA